MGTRRCAKLREVLGSAPTLERPTPTNREDLLFDDVLWVENAHSSHADFIAKVTSRGVELHDLLRPPRVSAAAAAQHY